ncbi:hypothetical protein AURDEDRAFT_52666, partial [Auricularia subglabra TFB-10046 SS5]
QALRRDNFRCVVTGAIDVCSSVKGHVVPQPGDATDFTQAAHILPEALNTNIHPITNKRYNTAGIWTMIACFTQDLKLPDELQANKIHRLDNIMTLAGGVHSAFDALLLWFKPPSMPHAYQTHGRYPWIPGAARTISFAHTDALPAPNAKFLALHALTCEVAHMSGAAEYVDDIQDDADERHVLAHDGSSAQLLASVLGLVAPVTGGVDGSAQPA